MKRLPGSVEKAPLAQMGGPTVRIPIRALVAEQPQQPKDKAHDAPIRCGHVLHEPEIGKVKGGISADILSALYAGKSGRHISARAPIPTAPALPQVN